MEWLIRRLFKRIKQRHPVEVYVGGKLIRAGSATIKVSLSEPCTITFEEPFK